MNDIKIQWLSGQGLSDTLVIDGHVHIGDWPHAATFQSVDQALSESQKLMDANGVDAFCAVSGGYIFGEADYRLGNDFLLQVWRRMPERLIPFLGINPNDSRQEMRRELDRMTSEGVRAIKLINAYQNNYPGDGPNLMALYAYAAEHRMLVFNHAWSYEVITKISQQFPETDFIFGHYGSWQDSILRDRPNVYANIWSYGPWGSLDQGVREVGAGKFILGSDGFLNALSVGIGPVVFAEIPDADKRQILGLTMARLLARIGALPKALLEKYQRLAPG
ncbi:MAG: amidohydrolase family protein [Lentisphaerae bacterium]|nr:amidohydrolase family protein [Lentisphaerota bacterium]